MAGPYQTPANERSFSSLIDEAIVMTGRPAALVNAVNHANLTIRECQSFGLFARDLLEETFSITDIPFIWTRPAFFRKIRTAQYVNAKIFPKFLLPGRQQSSESDYFYAADDYYVFASSSNSAVNDTLALANYYWAKPLVYYARLGTDTARYPSGPYAPRPAFFDVVTEEWMYLQPPDNTTYVTSLGDTVEEALRRKNAANWLTDEWREMILSGTKAKLFAQVGDTRANVEYAAYKATQAMFRTTVGLEAEGV